MKQALAVSALGVIPLAIVLPHVAYGAPSKPPTSHDLLAENPHLYLKAETLSSRDNGRPDERISQLPVGKSPSGSEIGAFVQSGVTVSLTAKQIGSLGPDVNVVAYGATGNGSTDDHAEIQKAINAAGNGGTVFLPATPNASYLIGATITIPYQYFTLRGERGSGLTLANGSTLRCSSLVTPSGTRNETECDSSDSRRLVTLRIRLAQRPSSRFWV